MCPLPSPSDPEPDPQPIIDAEKGLPLHVPEEATIDPKTLTPEEQMALYEESLKNTDWGHQPC